MAGTGLESSVSEINIAGARLAREAAQHAGHPVLVAGSVGPAVSAPAVRRAPASARAQTLREQIATLCDWVDLLILETFGDLESLVQAVEVATSCSDLPVVVQLTFGDDGRTLRGEEDPAASAAVLSRPRVTALGANCTVGPAVLVDVVGELDLRYRSSVVDALVSGHFLDAQDARRKARSLGLRDEPLRIAMLRPHRRTQRRKCSGSQRYCRMRPLRCVTARWS